MMASIRNLLANLVGKAKWVTYTIRRADGSDWVHRAEHSDAEHERYIVRIARFLKPGEVLSYKVE